MVVPAFINATGHVGQLQVRVWNFKKFLNFLSTRKFWYIWPFLGECVFTLSLDFYFRSCEYKNRTENRLARDHCVIHFYSFITFTSSTYKSSHHFTLDV